MEPESLQNVFEKWGECTVLLTGATGGIGKIIAAKLLSSSKIKLISISSKKHFDNNIIQCDLVRSEPVTPDNIDYIIHCACTYKQKTDLLMAKNMVSFAIKKKGISIRFF